MRKPCPLDEPRNCSAPFTWWSADSETHSTAFSNVKYAPALPSLLTLLAQALSRTLCQTGRWRNHSPLWCPSSRIRPGVAHEPRKKSQKARVLTKPPPYHSVSIIRNALPKLSHCSFAKKITTLSTDAASGHYRLWDRRRNKLRKNNKSW